MLSIELCINKLEKHKRTLLSGYDSIDLSLHEINSILEYLRKYQEVESTVNK